LAIDKKEILHIARLAHLDFSDEEYDRFTSQLNTILEYVAQLDQLDTASIEPTSHIGGGSHALRDDRVRRSIARDEALANAPQSAAGHFKVPKVIG
jgi:aspartyl-tRNA(Asn)/glutamyl-tRNA(Gln) amidotransferase subunit C